MPFNAGNIIVRAASHSDDAESTDKPLHKKCRNSQYIGDKIDPVQTVRFHSLN